VLKTQPGAVWVHVRAVAVFDQFADMLRGVVARKTGTGRVRSEIVVGSVRERSQPK